MAIFRFIVCVKSILLQSYNKKCIYASEVRKYYKKKIDFIYLY
jgi:hypothetical protein